MKKSTIVRTALCAIGLMALFTPGCAKDDAGPNSGTNKPAAGMPAGMGNGGAPSTGGLSTGGTTTGGK